MTKGIIISTLAAVLLMTACNNEPQQPQHPFSTEQTSAEKGAMIFNDKCAICHSKTKDIAGPALQGVLGRWDNDPERIKAFIRNSTEVIKAGDPSAVRSYEKYKAPMPAFPSLTDQELNNLIDYLKD
jgi:cytochrome c2